MTEENNDKIAEEVIEEATEAVVETVEEESVEEVIELSQEEQLRESLEVAEDKFLRAQAEVANMRNRFQKERETLLRYRSQDLAKELLSALDNLDRALAIEVADENGESLKKGIEMVRESILVGLKSSGVEEIESLGAIFDPNLHQAVQTAPIEEGQETDQIVNVLQKGYKLHDRVLRPTMVIVAQ